MTPKNRVPTHPGVILWEEFLLSHPSIAGDHTKLFDRLTSVYGSSPGFWKSLHEAYEEGESLQRK